MNIVNPVIDLTTGDEDDFLNGEYVGDANGIFLDAVIKVLSRYDGYPKTSRKVKDPVIDITNIPRVELKPARSNVGEEEQGQLGCCALCAHRAANKTNSHLIPNFITRLVSKVSSKAEREKEILCQIDYQHKTRAFIGRNVLPEEISSLYGDIGEEEIEQCKKDVLARDYILCCDCEKKLGDYLESPYSSHLLYGKKIEPHISAFFWLSVFWRMTRFDAFIYHLPRCRIEKLRSILSKYFEILDEGGNIAGTIFDDFPFSYHILLCREGIDNNFAPIYSEYDEKNDIASMFLGPIAVMLNFSGDKIPEGYTFYGFEKLFKKSELSSVTLREEIMEVPLDAYLPCVLRWSNENMEGSIVKDIEVILDQWSFIRSNICKQMPAKPSLQFITRVLLYFHTDKYRIGEKRFPEYYLKCFHLALRQLYGINL